MSITGTFIDEITYDIPSQNWSFEDWERDLDAMQAIGIDTVIIIRGGYLGRVTFPSKVVGDGTDVDLAGALFRMTSQRGMKMYMGLYTDHGWFQGDPKGEISVNHDFAREVLDRYGSHESFVGWYIPQEGSTNRFNLRGIFEALSTLCKDLAPEKKVLISPFYHSRKLAKEGFLEPEAHAEEWRGILQGMGTIDQMAFQDGTSPLEELDRYMTATKELADEVGVELWANVETFEREYPIKFPPIDVSILRRKIDIQAPYVTKLITFEFSHFMSPNSMWLSARHLYERYRELYPRQV